MCTSNHLEMLSTTPGRVEARCAKDRFLLRLKPNHGKPTSVRNTDLVLHALSRWGVCDFNPLYMQFGKMVCITFVSIYHDWCAQYFGNHRHQAHVPKSLASIAPIKIETRRPCHISWILRKCKEHSFSNTRGLFLEGSNVVIVFSPNYE